ncbi:hypothetical protein D2V93_18060 [Flagellimonas taeanensis]|nr:hypothetical protein D2V93_18060 [Allomuricauda taeanensis]
MEYKIKENLPYMVFTGCSNCNSICANILGLMEKKKHLQGTFRCRFIKAQTDHLGFCLPLTEFKTLDF